MAAIDLHIVQKYQANQIQWIFEIRTRVAPATLIATLSFNDTIVLQTP